MRDGTVWNTVKQLQAKVKELEGIIWEIANLCDNCRSIDDAIYIAGGRKDTSTESGCEKCWVQRLGDRNKKLKEFARYVIERECWSIYDQDGGDIQELAEKLGLISPHIATREDVDDSTDYEVGDTIYRFTKALKGE